MGATYTRQSSAGIVDGGVIEASDINNELDQLLAAFVASSGHTHDGTAAEGGPVTKLLGTSITIGDASAGTDIAVTFDGESADGVLTWMEDEDYFKFSDEVLMNSTEKLLFGDTGTYIHQSADGVLDLVSDTEIEINATTIDINGAVAMDGAITGATNITLSGELDAATLDISGNADIDGTTNLDAVDIDGAVQLDATLTVGADDQGYDIKFFGDTASAYMLWDTSVDDLVLAGAAGIDLAGDIDVDGTANLDAVDIDGAVQIDGAVTVGVDGTGLDVKFFGDTAGSFLLWDQSDDALELTDSSPIKIGDSADMQIYHDGTNSYITNSQGALKVATESSGIAITIGHTTSEVTIADNLTVTGTLTLGSNAELTEAELEMLDGITAGTVAASKAVVVDSNKDAASFRNVTLTGELDAATLDISGNADIDGTTNLDAVDVDGAVQIDNTVTVGVDGTGYDVKFFGDTSGAYMLWDQSTDDLVLAGAAKLYLYDAAGGEYLSSSGSALTIASGSAAWELPASDGSANQVLKTDGSGNLDWTSITSATITALNNATANELVTVGSTTTELDAEANLTFDGTTLTATALTVDDVAVDGKVVTMTGSSSDTAVFTAGTNGTLSIVTTDAAAAAANIQITADGTVDIDSAGVLTLDSGAAINIEPASGSAILLDGTISIDAGVVTGATSITSTAFVGTLSTAAQANVTSLGTLTTLTVDNVITNGATIGHTSDTDLLTLADGVLTVAGEVSATTLDIGGTNISSTAAELNYSDLATLGTSAASKVLSADANNLTKITGGIYLEEATLTFDSTQDWDVRASPVAKVTLTANVTFDAPTNPTTGQFISIVCIQDGTGSRTIAWNGVFEFTGDTAPTATTTGGKGDMFNFRYNGAKWLEVGRNLNLTLS